LAKDGHVKDDTPIQVLPKQCILLETNYNYHGGEAPNLEIEQEYPVETVQLKLSNEPDKQDFESITVWKDSGHRNRFGASSIYPEYPEEVLSTITRANTVLVVASRE
jgi:hypothetical protein